MSSAAATPTATVTANVAASSANTNNISVSPVNVSLACAVPPVASAAAAVVQKENSQQDTSSSASDAFKFAPDSPSLTAVPIASTLTTTTITTSAAATAATAAVSSSSSALPAAVAVADVATRPKPVIFLRKKQPADDEAASNASKSAPTGAPPHSQSTAAVSTAADVAYKPKQISLKLTLDAPPPAPPAAQTSMSTKTKAQAPAAAVRPNTVPMKHGPQQSNVSNTIESDHNNAAAGEGRRYGTRGTKLSKDFLKSTMDVDFGEEDDYLNEQNDRDEYKPAEGRRQQPNEIKTEFLFQDRENSSSRSRSSGAKNTTGRTNGENIDDDHDDVEEEEEVLSSEGEEGGFSDEEPAEGDGFIVNDFAKKGGKKRKTNPSSTGAGAVRGPAAKRANQANYVDRLSESAMYGTNANGGGPIIAPPTSMFANSNNNSSNSNVAPHRKAVGVPANNCLQIMKSLV